MAIMEKERVYIESSTVSYLCAKPSRDLILAAHQEITHEWWGNEKSQYELFISELVIDEIAKGNTDAAEKRLKAIKDIQLLPLTKDCISLAELMIKNHALPAKAMEDAIHIAIASIYNMDYLLTWNCTHIANPHTQRKIRESIEIAGYRFPVICTPVELLGFEMEDG
jgi:predicted nucleic acid-binding protein